MSKNQSLIHAYLFDGEGGAKRLSWADIEAWRPEHGILWVHLDYTVDYALTWLQSFHGIDTVTAEALVADESRPRAVMNSHSILLFLRGVNLNPAEEPEDMVSIRLWMDPHCIISTRKRKLLSVEDIVTSLQNGTGPKTTTEFLTLLTNHLTERMSDIIEELEDRMDGLEEAVLTAENHKLRTEISDVRRTAIMMRRYLAPQREALSRLSIDETSLINSTQRLRFRESTDRVVRYIENLDTVRERGIVTQEELASKLSELMEKRMYVLSFVAVVFLPISFITGLLGINVGGIPGANNDLSFLVVCLILTAVVAAMFAGFKKFKWI